MRVADKRLTALREYHAQRIVNTRTKLNEALDRIEAGNTVVIKHGAKLTKTNLCLEAGVNIHTLLKKIGKAKRLRFGDIITRLEDLTKKTGRKNPGDEKDEKIVELKEAVRVAEADKLNMAREIDDIGMKLLAANEEIARLSSLEEQNADLREEIRRMQEPAKLRLVGNGKGGKNVKGGKK